jgi:hypothetical protein
VNVTPFNSAKGIFIELTFSSGVMMFSRFFSAVIRGLDPRIHQTSRESCEEDGLPGAQTSLRSLRKADYYARQ